MAGLGLDSRARHIVRRGEVGVGDRVEELVLGGFLGSSGELEFLQSSSPHLAGTCENNFPSF